MTEPLSDKRQPDTRELIRSLRAIAADQEAEGDSFETRASTELLREAADAIEGRRPPIAAEGATQRVDAVQRVWESEGCTSALAFIQLARQLERELDRELSESDDDRLRAIGLYESCKAELAEAKEELEAETMLATNTMVQRDALERDLAEARTVADAEIMNVAALHEQLDEAQQYGLKQEGLRYMEAQRADNAELKLLAQSSSSVPSVAIRSIQRVKGRFTIEYGDGNTCDFVTFKELADFIADGSQALWSIINQDSTPPSTPQPSATVAPVKGFCTNEEAKAEVRHAEAIRQAILPKAPPLSLLVSMALRVNHGFGLDDARSQQVQLSNMGKVYEEMAGHGFYSPDRTAYYMDMVKGYEVAGTQPTETVATLICPRCKVDRLKEACPEMIPGKCGLQADAKGPE